MVMKKKVKLLTTKLSSTPRASQTGAGKADKHKALSVAVTSSNKTNKKILSAPPKEKENESAAEKVIIVFLVCLVR